MISKELFTKRQVHLDFHTSPDIDGIGKKFDKKKFQDVLRLGNINSITVFAKCHHGLCYYPTTVGKMHPHLDFDLTGAMVDAAHEIGVRAPVYITAGWSDQDAKEHPEWISKNKDGSEITSDNFEKLTDPDAPKLHCAWQTLCLNDGSEYTKHIYDLTEEICQRYDALDGLFYDICIVGSPRCYCDSCLSGMKKKGIDIDDDAAVFDYYVEKRSAFMKKCGEILKKYHPDATIFFNSGGANQYKPQYHGFQTHYEMEDLPTAWGGYNKLPLRAKYFNNLGKPTLAMTGKFHLDWGEFGGFKPKEALKYEIALMATYGVGASIGDHLHPDGEPEKETYKSIGYAYDYLEKIAPYCYGGKSVANLGLFVSNDPCANEGISQILSENQLDYEVVTEENVESFDTIIVANGARPTEKELSAIKKHLSLGKGLVVIGNALLNTGKFLVDFGVKYLGEAEFDCDYICSDDTKDRLPGAPMLCRIPSHRISAEGQDVLAYAIDPYFSRTAAHFCGHKNTPHNKASARRPAIVKSQKTVYLAHPMPDEYYLYGSIYNKRYFMKALDSVYSGAPIKVKGLMSEGKFRAIKQESESRYCINVTYASPSKRGAAEIIEDIVPIYNIEFSASLPERIKKVVLPLSGKEIPFEYEDQTLRFTLQKLDCHETIILEY